MKFQLTFDVEFPSRPEFRNGGLILILEKLAEKGVLATFFVEGRWASANTELLELLHAGGHKIGNHLFHHCNAINLTPIGLYRELKNTEKILSVVTGSIEKRLFRLPYGSGHKSFYIQVLLKFFGYKHIHWDVDSFDWRDNADRVRENLEEQLRDYKGDKVNILFHSWPDSTIEGLDFILEAFGSEDFEVLH